ncbi:unnamed protein product [Mucor hiemalis]
MESHSYRDEKSPSLMTQANSWFDQYILQQPLLPQQQQQQKSKGFLKSRPFRLVVLFYIIFSILLATVHFTRWALFHKSADNWTFQRTYDPLEPYSLMSDMSHGLKMSKLFSKGQYEALKYVKPYWKKAQQVPEESDVTMITTATPDSWKDLVNLAENWDGPISATLHISTSIPSSVKGKIESEYKSNAKLSKNLDLHLVEIPSKQVASVLIPLNVERNMARIYARSQHVCDMPLDIIIATDLRQTLLKNKSKYTQWMKDGDMLVIPTFKHIHGNDVPLTKKELVGLVESEKSLGLYDTNFKLNEGPTHFETWKKATQVYTVSGYTMDYEPIVIQSKTVQPWCSERFVNKRSACLLSNYLAGNNFLVLPNDYAITKPNAIVPVISDLDVSILSVYSLFYF